MRIEYGHVEKKMAWLNTLIGVIYILWWFNFKHVGNWWLYGLLFFGEIYHLIMALTFWMTASGEKRSIHKTTKSLDKWVDIFVTVCGEPVEIVEKTIAAAKNIDYEKKRIYVLNDGFVANKENWMEIGWMAERMGVECITRRIKGGAKAGNVNNALRKTQGELVAIFDADMVPKMNFLNRLVRFFEDEKMGFVQSPQYYGNKSKNYITKSAWEQQELFFGPIMVGKDRSNAAFICGTNFVARRTALEEAGGLKEDNIAEDFVTSIEIHRKGWKSEYINEVLCQGLAPEDMLSYYKQQLRWARGSLEILFKNNPLFVSGLSLKQKIEYISSALYYFGGVIVLIDIIMPLIFMFGGTSAVRATSTSFALFFVPFMLVNLLTINRASNKKMTFRAMAFSQSSFVIYLEALASIISGRKIGFSVTPKQQQQGNFLHLAKFHIGYIFLTIVGTGVRLYKEDINPSVVTNIAWAGFNCVMFLPYIRACFDWKGWVLSFKLNKESVSEIVSK